jgi:hypothetical protein
MLPGDECAGDECVGDKCVGDKCVGDGCVGDECVGDECAGDECAGDRSLVKVVSGSDNSWSRFMAGSAGSAGMLADWLGIVLEAVGRMACVPEADSPSVITTVHCGTWLVM